MKIRDHILRYGPWVVPLMVLLASLAVEDRLLSAPVPASRFRALLEEVRPRVASMNVNELAARRRVSSSPLHLIDVREDSEWAAGHEPDARHLSKGLIERDIEKTVPDPAATIVLYCESGGRSLLAAENLQRMGYSNVFSLEGGYRAWRAAQAGAAR